MPLEDLRGSCLDEEGVESQKRERRRRRTLLREVEVGHGEEDGGGKGRNIGVEVEETVRLRNCLVTSMGEKDLGKDCSSRPTPWTVTGVWTSRTDEEGL